MYIYLDTELDVLLIGNIGLFVAIFSHCGSTIAIVVPAIVVVSDLEQTRVSLYTVVPVHHVNTGNTRYTQ